MTANSPTDAATTAADEAETVETESVETETVETSISIEVAHDIASIPARDWNLCAFGPSVESESEDEATESFSEAIYPNPFISHAFLNCLEESGCVGDGTGWHPHHLAIRDTDGEIAAVMPAYLKTHSQGEYVFDYGWADAFERAGGRYYPKVQISVPFTPATGRRLLVREDRDDAERFRLALIAGAQELTRQADASSIHWTFMERDEWDAVGKLGLLQRTDRQFHWLNDGYETFDDFLAALSSRKRKVIRRERRDAAASDLTFTWKTGNDITEADWDAFHGFYMDTGYRKWGRPYLNRQFFSLLGERMAKSIALIFAERDGQPIAGALNFIGTDTLFGRHWGCLEHHPFLHFEVCYYQAIDFAIRHKLGCVEAGAQGEHKLARGYVPVETYSAHHIRDSGLRDAVADYLDRERRHVSHEIEALGQYTPFRKGEPTDG